MTDIPAQLAREFQRLGQRMPGDNAQSVAIFSAKPMEAYTLAAALQATSRHPGLSDSQREIVLGFAHQVADQLVAMCRALLGPDSAIETTMAMGFDPQFDVDEHGRSLEVMPGGLEEPDDDDGDDLDDEEEPDSHVIGERRVSYVEPSWIHLSTDPEDAELLKCAKCSRFFVQSVPIRLFQELGDHVVLGMEVCERCAPSVMQHMMGDSR